MFIANSQDRDILGLHRILSEAPCLTPEGQELQRDLRFARSQDRSALDREFAVLEQLRAYCEAKPKAVRDAENILKRFRPIRLTLQGIADERVLDPVEFFELKRNLRLQRQLAVERELWQAAALELENLDEAWQLLNPEGSDHNGFHVYTSYSEKLKELRQKKTALEAKIVAVAPEKRGPLLSERSDIQAYIVAEETVVLRRLGQKFRSFLEPWQANLLAIGRLDFRLARAKLGIRWSSPRPHFLADGEGVKLEAAREPWLAEEMAAQGQEFTPQDLEMSAGATIITGANMGGKSVALRSIICQLMLVQMGYYPACKSLDMELFDFFAFTTDNPGDGSLGLSSFGMEAAQFREQLRLIRHYKGFVVLDEPARGTNPKEAQAIVTGLCRIYAETSSYLVIATHYRIPPQEGFRYYKIAGLSPSPLRRGRYRQKQHPSAAAVRETAGPDQPAKLANAPTVDLNLANAEATHAARRMQEDRAAAKWIRQNMDYRLRPSDGHSLVPAEALQIAAWMGLEDADIEVMRQAYMEEN